MNEEIYTVKMDRPLGSVHPDVPTMVYPVNYGYVEGIMAKDGEGFGVGEYVLIDGANKDSDDSTWEMRLPSYKFGKEYTLKMMKKDLDEKETYRTVEKTTIGDTEYLYVDYDSSIYYYTVANNHPILIQVIGDSMVDNEAVMAALESIRYNY